MARILANTVVVDGVTYEAGTKETADLKKAISNPVAWTDDGEKSVPSKSDSGK